MNYNKSADFLDKIIHGDCLKILPKLPSQYVDLIITSPPYAKRRSRTYGGVEPDEYVEWFLEISEELMRVLKPTGSFILNIKEPAINGERHTFVIELILKLREQGWFWIEEYCWHKKNSHPGKWPNRFRDSWERCLHFTLNKQFSMYQDSVMVPAGKWRDERFKKLNENDIKRYSSKVKSGFGRNVSNWLDRDKAYPTNVLHMATECSNRGHSAAFPIDLPSWFIKLFSQPNDIVLDPFIGSGTTAVACQNLQRHFIGIEKYKKYCLIAQERCSQGLTANS